MQGPRERLAGQFYAKPMKHELRMPYNLKQLLTKSFDDFRLSSSEKYDLREALGALESQHDDLNAVRNMAFAIVREQLTDSIDHQRQSLKWLEQVTKSIDAARSGSNPTINNAYFSPGATCAEVIIRKLKGAKRTIAICVFTISDNRITEAIVAAHQRGIDVRVITDNDKTEDRGSDIDELARLGVAVKVDTSPNHMHHKFAVFDRLELINGSFNWTRSASNYNQENIVVSNDLKLIAAFTDEFEKLWRDCIAHSG